MGMSLRQWLLNRQMPHEQVTKFQKKPHHKKKTISEKEKAKRDWREHNKLRRDRARGRPHFDWGELNREFNNRSYRRWSKQRIKNNDYDLERGWKKEKYFKTDWVW